MASSITNGPLDRYVKLRVAHATGMPGTVSPPPWVSDPDMHHGTYVTHVPRCMPGSLTSGLLEVGGRENVPVLPAHAQPAILRILVVAFYSWHSEKGQAYNNHILTGLFTCFSWSWLSICGSHIHKCVRNVSCWGFSRLWGTASGNWADSKIAPSHWETA